jgi:hypothetical protein
LGGSVFLVAVACFVAMLAIPLEKLVGFSDELITRLDILAELGLVALELAQRLVSRIARHRIEFSRKEGLTQINRLRFEERANDPPLCPI